MRGALGGPRVLLRRLREVMAEPVSAQDRLDKVVVLIAANMVAEVCSVYVLRVDGTLELYATEGLKREAVHQTVLKADEGLVGLVASEAKPINLSDAQAHPAFSYRPETGEEIYHSFLGVPILRAGNTLGVLVVQNRARRTYTEEEEEALQTTAMVLAEMIASGELSSLATAGRRAGRAAADASYRQFAVGRHRARPRGAARAARRHHQRHRRRVPQRTQTSRRGDRDVARGSRSRWSSTRRRRRRRTSRRARSLPHVRLRPGLAAQDSRSRHDRPDRGSRRRARAVRHARAHAARIRSLSARPAARSRRPRQPADARPDGPGPRADQGAAAGKRHRGRALDGSGRAARLRPQAAARPGAGGRRPDLPCLDRRARARHSDGRRNRQCHRSRRAGRRHHRRRLDRRTSICGRRRTSRPPMPRGSSCAPAGRRNIARCASGPASPRTAKRSR